MVPSVASIVRWSWLGSCLKQERIIYEEQPFYSLERIPKPQENAFGTRYLVKLAVAGVMSNKVPPKKVSGDHILWPGGLYSIVK